MIAGTPDMGEISSVIAGEQAADSVLTAVRNSTAGPDQLAIELRAHLGDEPAMRGFCRRLQKEIEIQTHAKENVRRG